MNNNDRGAVVISVKRGMFVMIGDDIMIEIRARPNRGHTLMLVIRAPKDLPIYRHKKEVQDEKQNPPPASAT